MALGDVIARLAVSLNLETASFERGAKKAQSEAQTLRNTMTKVAGAIGTAFVGAFSIETFNQMRQMTKEALNTIGSLGEEAQQLGVTTAALQEFRYVASQTGVEQGEMDKALQRLTRTIGDLAAPTKAQAAALEQMGLKAADFTGKGADEAILVLADGMAKLPDAATRSSVGFDLMGRSFQTLLPLLNEGSAGIQQMITDAREAGIVLTEKQIADADKAADALTAIETKTQARLAAIYAKNGESLVKFETQWAEFKIGLAEGFVSFNDSYTKFQQRMFQAGEAARAWRAETWKAIFGLVADVKSAIADRLSAIWDGAIKKIETVKRAFFDLWDRVTRRSYIPDMVDDIAQEMGRLDAVMVQPVAKATTKAEQAFRDMAENARAIMERLFPEAAAQIQYQADRAALVGADVGDAALRALANERDLDQGGRPSFNIGGEPIATTEQGLRSLDAAMDSLINKGRKTSVQIAESFKDMASKTLQSLSSLTSAIKSGGFLGILEGIIGFGLQLGGIGAFGKTVAGRINAAPRAMGGPISAGRPYLVGERGPELVVPNHSGRVISNDNTFGETVVRVQLSEDLDARIMQGAGRVVLESAGPIIGRAKAETMREMSRRKLG